MALGLSMAASVNLESGRHFLENGVYECTSAMAGGCIQLWCSVEITLGDMTPGDRDAD